MTFINCTGVNSSAGNIIVMDDSVLTAITTSTKLSDYSFADNWRLSVFAEGSYQGNSAYIQYSPSPLSHAAMLASAGVASDATRCYVWPIHAQISDRVFACHCYGKGGRINCCGHGLLACAHVIANLPEQSCLVDAQRHECTDEELAISPSTSPSITVKYRDGRFCLQMMRLRCQSVAIPSWVNRAFDQAPLAAALAGDDNDYLILEWPAEANLAKLQADFCLISQMTRRAVIVTQASLDQAFDFKLRYFAPQYGTNEDAVTGSANRVLADYWFQKTGQYSFRALQCSIRGGIVYSELTAQHVLIAGSTQLMPPVGEHPGALPRESEKRLGL